LDGSLRRTDCLGVIICHESENINRTLEKGTEALEAATTELLVAGVAEWVRFVRNRWQEKSLMCAWPIIYEAREKYLKLVGVIILYEIRRCIRY